MHLVHHPAPHLYQTHITFHHIRLQVIGACTEQASTTAVQHLTPARTDCSSQSSCVHLRQPSTIHCILHKIHARLHPPISRIALTIVASATTRLTVQTLRPSNQPALVLRRPRTQRLATRQHQRCSRQALDVRLTEWRAKRACRAIGGPGV